jgi:hypothetical protein
MTDDEFDAKASDALDRWYENGGDFNANWHGSLAQVISTALREAVKAEREACAVEASLNWHSMKMLGSSYVDGACDAGQRIARAIRARSAPIAQVVQPKLNT